MHRTYLEDETNLCSSLELVIFHGIELEFRFTLWKLHMYGMDNFIN